MENQGPYTVSQLTFYIKHLLEEDNRLQALRLEGEVSNLTYHRSGHVYFALKDTEAQISCALFKSHALRAPRIKEGDKIEVLGDISVYAPRGNYQLLVRQIKKAGLGELHLKFEKLKHSLAKEGLFDQEHKLPKPLFPKSIAVLTSPTGAAIRDILRTLKRRWPGLNIYIFPTVVQGINGVRSICQNLEKADQLGLDLILLARGGGSIEDLWNFNEEEVVRKIFELSTPLISGIGHETDFTLSDFVADMRASTPTAAAEMAVQEMAAWKYTLEDFGKQLVHAAQHYIDIKRQRLDDLSYRYKQSLQQGLLEKRHILEMLEAKLLSMDMTKILEQGYTLSLKDGKIVNSASELIKNDELETRFKDGSVFSKVK